MGISRTVIVLYGVRIGRSSKVVKLLHSLEKEADPSAKVPVQPPAVAEMSDDEASYDGYSTSSDVKNDEDYDMHDFDAIEKRLKRFFPSLQIVSLCSVYDSEFRYYEWYGCTMQKKAYGDAHTKIKVEDVMKLTPSEDLKKLAARTHKPIRLHACLSET